jgi:hypothetical protein
MSSVRVHCVSVSPQAKGSASTPRSDMPGIASWNGSMPPDPSARSTARPEERQTPTTASPADGHPASGRTSWAATCLALSVAHGRT